jgi:hypothetical protein
VKHYFYSNKEKADIMYPMLEWLHTCVDENKRGRPFDWDVYSQGACFTIYKSKNYKWEIHNEHSGNMVVTVHDDFAPLFDLKWL